MFRRPSPEEQRAYIDGRADVQAAKELFPVGSYVFLTTTKQYGIVDGHTLVDDAPALRVHGIGVVPVAELRQLTEQEINERSKTSDE